MVQVCAHEDLNLLEDLCSSGFLLSSTLVITSTVSLGDINGDPYPIVRIFPHEGLPPEESVIIVDAHILGADQETEMALLELRRAVSHPGMRRDDASALQAGESVITMGHPWMSRGYGSWLVTGGSIIEPCFDGPQTIWTNLRFHEGSQGGPAINMHGEKVGMVRQRDKIRLDPEICVPLAIAQNSWHRAQAEVMLRQETFEPITAKPHIDIGTITQLVEGWLADSGASLPDNPP